MMIGYHFCFDLTYYRWADWPMLDDARWIAWRSAIVTCFLFVAGVSLALRDHRERGRPAAWFATAFVRRWAQVAVAAALVTVATMVVFPATFIYFGVLHFVAVAVWLCRRAPRLGGWAIAAGIAVIAIGLLFDAPVFDPRVINWVGFAASKPLTEDYVPLFPWLGVVLLGCGFGALWARRHFAMSSPIAAAWDATPRRLRRLLITSGRWSLTIYLLHQPLLLATMGLVRRIG